MKSARGSTSAATALGIALSVFATAAGFVTQVLKPPLGEESLFYAVAGIAALGGIIFATSRKGPQRVWHRYAWPASAIAAVLAYDSMLNFIKTPSIPLLGIEVLLFCVATFQVFVLCLWATRGLIGAAKVPANKRVSEGSKPS